MTPLSRLCGCLLILLLTLPSSAEAGTKRNPATVREFKRTHICPSTGTYTQKCPGFVVDHLTALCAGGQDAVENMAYQEYNASIEKDKLERAECRAMRGKK